MFFDRPLPTNLITVPACDDCNHAVHLDEEYFRLFLVMLRDSVPSLALENVRARAKARLHRWGRLGLLSTFRRATWLRVRELPDGPPTIEPVIKPDSARLWNVLTRYARGLHFLHTGDAAPAYALLSIDRLFNRGERPHEYWEPLLAAEAYACVGDLTSRGSYREFQFTVREVNRGDAMSVVVLDFYQSFRYVAIIAKPGTLRTAIRLPF
jgi:hypothetical protein